jgi:hypothetical protein
MISDWRTPNLVFDLGAIFIAASIVIVPRATVEFIFRSRGRAVSGKQLAFLQACGMLIVVGLAIDIWEHVSRWW